MPAGLFVHGGAFYNQVDIFPFGAILREGASPLALAECSLNSVLDFKARGGTFSMGHMASATLSLKLHRICGLITRPVGDCSGCIARVFRECDSVRRVVYFPECSHLLEGICQSAGGGFSGRVIGCITEQAEIGRYCLHICLIRRFILRTER
jgi:hypothetical protein